jgi:cell division protein FtsL
MVDLAAGIEARNYGLRKTTEPKALWETLKIILPLTIIAGALSFHIWIQSQSVDLGYQNQELVAQEQSSLRIRQQLILEEETVKNLASLEQIARNELGMIHLKASQIIPAPLDNSDTVGSETLAMGTPSQFSETRKRAVFN